MASVFKVDRPRRVIFVQRGPGLLPVLVMPGRRVERHDGRPRSEVTRPAQVEYFAWLRGCAGLSAAEIARRLSADVDDDGETSQLRKRRRDRRNPYSAAVLRQVQRDIRAGRRSLAARGVLPWAAFAEGEVATEWWRHPAFESAITRWQKEAILEPVPRTANGPPQASAELGARLAAEHIARGLEASAKAHAGVAAKVARGLRAVDAAAVPPWRFDETLAA
jgi:hypothetical protein